VASLGEQIAAIGRLPYAGALEYAADPEAHRLGASEAEAGPRGGQHNSAQRLAAVWATLRVPEPVRAVLAGLEGPVLLVDDRIETGWTMTVAAKLVREAGASAVLPFVLTLGG
jgi:ATP-dependent DNA helicase RecQ